MYGEGARKRERYVPRSERSVQALIEGTLFFASTCLIKCWKDVKMAIIMIAYKAW